jgi:O-antigen ligase
MPVDRLFLVCAVVMVCCLLFGGGTRPGFLSDVIIQLLAIPLLAMAFHRLAGLPSARHLRWALLFCLAIVLVPLLQLVPLPPELWTALPNREPAVEAFRLLGRELPWMPISMSPHATWLSALSLLPPVALFLTTLLVGRRERRELSLILVTMGIVSVFVGLLQVAQGPGSSLRFFAITNDSEAVGFFANRNHFAALLYACTVLAGAWAVEAAAPPAQGRTKVETRWIVPLIAAFTALVILVAAQAIARSRAGLGLTIAALLGAVLLAVCDRRNASGVTPARLLFAATALAAVFAAQFALFRLLERFGDDPLQDGRITFARLTAEAAQLYMPFGSGMGTFVPVYGMQERPQDALPDIYVNRAHNDVLELWLESGLIGPGLLAIFLLWLAIRAATLWRRNAPGQGIDLMLARAGTILVALIVAHSLVDYPLRTGAIMAILAFACGLMVAPLSGRYAETAGEDRPAAADQPRPPPARRPADASVSQHPPGRWGSDVEWPEEWR